MSNNENENTNFVTAYEAHKVMNEMLSKEGLPAIRPQMMYNYITSRINEGKKPLQGIEYTEKNGVDIPSFAKFVTLYIAKKKALMSININN